LEYLPETNNESINPWRTVLVMSNPNMRASACWIE